MLLHGYSLKLGICCGGQSGLGYGTILRLPNGHITDVQPTIHSLSTAMALILQT